MTAADAIVVGAGPAGCVVASRLAAAGMAVTLCEAGPGPPTPPELTTIDSLGALDVADRFWPRMAATPIGARPHTPYRLGRGLGGGGAVNAMVMTTGDRADYERWENQGAVGWGWARVGPWFDELGRAFGTEPASLGPLGQGMAAAVTAAGGVAGGTSVTPDQRGFAAASLTARDGRRYGPAEMLLAGPSGIHFLDQAPVRRVVFDGRRATGVELADGTRLGAGRVVVCAGALHSPALLRASGVAAVGDRRPVVDHPSVVLTVVLGPEARCPLDRPVAPISGVLRWSSDQGMGPAGDTSAPFPPVADLMTFVMDHVGAGSEGRRYGALVVVLADVASVGSLWWEGSRARFDPGWLAHPVDRQRLVAGVRQVAELVASTPMADVVEEAYADEYGTPLAEVVGLDDAELARWLEAHPGPVVHPAATCAPVSLRPTAEPPDGAGLAGAAIDAVVDLDGSVRGHTRLHVIDGSTLPYVPAANPQLPIMAVATGLASNLVDGATP